MCPLWRLTSDSVSYHAADNESPKYYTLIRGQVGARLKKYLRIFTVDNWPFLCRKKIATRILSR